MSGSGYGAVMTDPILKSIQTQDSDIATLQKSLAADEVTIASHTSTLSSHTSTIGTHTTDISTLQTEAGVIRPYRYYFTPQLAIPSTSTATILVANKTYFQYLGRIPKAIGSVTLLYWLKTQMVASTDPSGDFAEFSIWKGAQTYTNSSVPASLTRVDFEDCYLANDFLHAPGRLTKALGWTTSTTSDGDDLWLGVSANIGSGGTMPQFEALTVDRLGLGICLIADGRSSTIGTDGVLSTGITVNSTVAPIECLAYFV